MISDKIDPEVLLAAINNKIREKAITGKLLAEELQVSREFASRLLHTYSPTRNRNYEVLLEYLNIEQSELKDASEDPVTQHGSTVFISYSHRDEEYLTRLLVHLNQLERLDILEVWSDTNLQPGTDWKGAIEKAITSARVAILLVSADFLASPFIQQTELPIVLQQLKKGEIKVYPIVIGPCRYSRDDNLRKIQSINDPNEPVMGLVESEREVIFDAVAKRLENLFHTELTHNHND